MNWASRYRTLHWCLALLGLLLLVAVFADLLASEAPLVMSRGGKVTVLPALSAPETVRGRTAAEIAALLGTKDWAVWPPVRAGGVAGPAGGSGGGGGPHLLGTDHQGRDVVARFIHGARTTVLFGAAVLAVSLLLGLPLGALAGAGPRPAGWLLSRAVELSGSFPAIVLVMLVRSSQPSGGVVSFVALVGVLSAIRMARLLRGEVSVVASEPFVVAAVALGARPSRVMWRHILPHALRPVLVCAAFTAASVVAFEAAMSFLGLGLPAWLPSWGSQLGELNQPGGIRVAWLPALGIVLTTAALCKLGDCIELGLGPRVGGQRPTPPAVRDRPR
jgi:peptide/nickel transport system permease protein